MPRSRESRSSLPLRLMVCVLLAFTAPAAIAQDAAAEAEANGIRPAIVKVHSTVRLPDPFRPWTKQAAQEATGSGVVIDGNRILTNAHVVRYASQVYVQPYQSADRLAAKVDSISHEMDLAILKLEDEAFFEDRPALSFAEGLPRVKQQVNVYGYPTGGEELSITEGIVSRIEVGGYNHGAVGLIVQVDAALNPGNSGGAAIIDGRIAGIVRANIPTAENIGYLIPVEEVQTYLADVEDGTYDGKFRFEAGLQTTENPALRDRLGLDRQITGLMVTRPDEPLDNGDDPLHEWDVITHIAGHPIDNDGQVRLTDDLRVAYHYYVDQETIDGKLPLTVFRDGQTIDVQTPVSRKPDLIVPSLDGDYPRYYIFGPLCFTQVTREMVGAIPGQLRGALIQGGSPLLADAFEDKQHPDQEMVAVASPLFPHRITKGYDNPVLGVIAEVNGTGIENLRQLAQVCETAEGEFIEIKFADEFREHMVFKRQAVLDAREEILTDNGIRHRASDDLRDVLKD